MSGETFGWFFVGSVWGVLLITLLFTFREESRRWRRLMQLYFEKQVQAPLPVDEDPAAPAESALHLPADELEELERLQELEDEARAQRLS